MFPFDPPENIRKLKGFLMFSGGFLMFSGGFLMFSGGSKGNIGTDHYVARP